jgi:hypothetical protein
MQSLNQRAMLHSYPVAASRVRKEVTFLTTRSGVGAVMGRNSLQSDPMILCASRDESLEGVQAYRVRTAALFL